MTFDLIKPHAMVPSACIYNLDTENNNNNNTKTQKQTTTTKTNQQNLICAK